MKPAGRTRRTDAASNRDRILDAARAVLAERGLAAEVMEIADRAGVGAGTLYRNFGTKNELIRAVVSEMAETFHAAVATAARHERPRDGIADFIRSGFRLTDRYGKLLLDLLAGSAGEAFEGVYDRARTRALISAMFERGVQSGEFSDDLDVEFALAMLQGLFSPRALESMLAVHSAAEIAELAVAYFLRAVRGSESPKLRDSE